MARAARTAITVSEIRACTIISSLAQRDRTAGVGGRQGGAGVEGQEQIVHKAGRPVGLAGLRPAARRSCSSAGTETSRGSGRAAGRADWARPRPDASTRARTRGRWSARARLPRSAGAPAALYAPACRGDQRADQLEQRGEHEERLDGGHGQAQNAVDVVMPAQVREDSRDEQQRRQ